MDKAMEGFILNASYYDVLDYKKQNKVPVVESYEINQWSYIVEIMLITIKSLKPCQVKGGNIVDYNRFKKELELWKYYRHGMNKSLLYSMGEKRYGGYFSGIDESVYSRISVITLANQNWKVIKSEIIKNILFSTGNIEMITECLLLSRILFLKLANKNIKYEDLLMDIKQEIINFSPLDIDLDEKNSTIEFERYRVNLITKLNGIDMDNKFSLLMRSLKILKSQEGGETREIEDLDNFFISGLVGIVSGEVMSRDIKDFGFLESLCSYMVKLRKGRISLEDFKLEDYKELDIFSYNKGDTFLHPLLNFSKIIYKGSKENFEIIYVNTKTGIYRFVRRKK